MPDFPYPKNEFLNKVIAAIEENLSNENFGVSELADKINMSRSNLLRKVKSATDLSVSLLIRQVRLYHAKDLLNEGELNISEISYQVGFSSTSYFTKCFREQFGYPPGEEINKSAEFEEGTPPHNKKPWLVITSLLALIISAILYLIYAPNEDTSNKPLEKTIAVLPFKNNSNDASNVYLINGVTDAILNHLQKIEDMKVTSRTTTEKYREVIRTIPELSEELNVNYFLEGSGQKIGDQILLTVQLIQARKDQPIWSERYERKSEDIFQLQTEVAKNIAKHIEATITPDEAERMEKIPTENLKAYDLYLRGQEHAREESYEGLLAAVELFQQAISEDEEFAHAYAFVAICYYYMDLFQANKQYGLEINTFADRAMLLDPEAAESLIAKALFYMQDKQYKLAIQYFEKVLIISPHSGWIHNFLTDIYTTYIPNTEKYLEHALQGIQAGVAGQDSITASFTYLHLSNALAQNGFIVEAEQYVKKSLAHYPENLYSETLYAYIKLAGNFNLQSARESLIQSLNKDTTQLHIIQEIAKVCYMQHDYKTAWFYYEKFNQIKKNLDLDIYGAEDLKIAFVLEKLGQIDKSQQFLANYYEYTNNDTSIYKDLLLSAYYAYIGDIEKGIEHFAAFSKQENYMYWFVLFLEKDPILLELKDHPEFNEIIRAISDNFWVKHQELEEMLKGKI
ncbi:helix-turn-helix domain-containing protein [Reichenbachiella sp.]|uniref:helix-turn-helix domain-containing protein n=1 Tax=Reichenbachiella sp. TaxID=2184521 RepID=UPI003B5A76EE